MLKTKLIFALLALIFVGAGRYKAPSNDTLTVQQVAGKKIYEKGIGNSDTKIMAIMSGVKVPATVMPCANCHKKDGTGNPEGGIVPSNLRWSQLTKNYQASTKSGRSHPAYTEQSFRKAVTMGVDPAGNELNLAMPRYIMSRTDMDNLTAYLKVLGKSHDMGLNEKEIKIGVVMPSSLASNGLSKTVEKLINAHCDRINKKGGIYNRQLHPNYIYLAPNASESAIHQTLTKSQSFVLTGLGLYEEEDAVANYANQNEIPAVLPFSQNTTANGLTNKQVFYLYPSLQSEAISLYEFALKKKWLKSGESVQIVYQTDNLRSYIAKELKKYIRNTHNRSVQLISIEDWQPNQKNTPVVVYLGGANEGQSWLNKLAKSSENPKILVPGSVSGINVFQAPIGLSNQIYTAYPTWGSVITKPGLDYFRQLQLDYQLENRWKNNQLNVLSMLLLIENSLKHSGKDVSGDKVVASLEGLFQYSTGLTPPVSYSLNKRAGSQNIYITNYNPSSKGVELIATWSSSE